MFPPRACLLIRELSELKLWRRKGKDKHLVLRFWIWTIFGFVELFSCDFRFFFRGADGHEPLNVRLMRCALPWHTLDIAFSLKGHEVHSRIKGQLNLHRTEPYDHRFSKEPEIITDHGDHAFFCKLISDMRICLSLNLESVVQTPF